MNTRRWIAFWLSLLVVRFVAASLIVMLHAPSVFAQSAAASVSGRVTDQDGLVMPDVEVELKSVDTNVSQVTKTNSEGFYAFPAVKPGNYLMSVRKQLFRTVSVTGITLNVQDNVSRNFVLQVGSSAESMTVTADSLNMNTTDASVSTVVDRQFVENLPLNGRSFNTLLQLTPGVVIAPATPASTGQFSISGQRTDANNFTVDGVSANFGVSGGFQLTSSGTGAQPGFSALGGTSSLVSVEALQEFRVETSSFAPEFGRTPGGQVILTTRSGTNAFHGGIYDYFRNTALDANNWFNNAAGIPRAPEDHNDFGVFVGGPIRRDKTFFFASYEGARLRLPNSQVIQVPSSFARSQASTTLAPFLSTYPLSNGQPASPTAYTAPFTGSFSNTATLDAGSIRVDHTFNDHLAIFARYNDAPSFISMRINSLNEIQNNTTNTRTLTFGLNMFLTHGLSNILRGNYSTQSSRIVFTADSLGGAVPLDPKLLLGGSLSSADSSFTLSLPGAAVYGAGPIARNKTTQLNFVDDLAVIVGKHQLKIGGDYRAIYLDEVPSSHSATFIASNIPGFIAIGNVTVSAATRVPSQFLVQAFSLYGQDSWKMTPRLTVTYGLRWELSPAPSARNGTTLAAWANVDNPPTIALAPSGTELWTTTVSNIAPRVGVAYRLTEKGNLVLRVGGGVFYDLGIGTAANLGAFFPNSFGKVSFGQTVPISDLGALVPTVSLQPPFISTIQGISPDLKLPRSYQWNVALEKAFAGKQAVAATYVGQAGRRLLRSEVLPKPNANFTGNFQLLRSQATSDYDALQLQYRRILSKGLQALVNYTWSHSIDNSSDDTAASLSSLNTVISGLGDRASSSFDVRHSFSGAIIYAIPGGVKSGVVSTLTKDWSIETNIVARSGFPFNALLNSLTPAPGVAPTRPDIVAGQPVWISNPQTPGGKSLNPNAFAIPTTLRQGTESRNDITGFGLTQVDMSIGRKISITERLNLQLRADAFNLFNHPNFANPNGFIQNGQSGLQSIQMLNQGLGGLNALFQEGGPRSLQLSLKLTF